MKSLKPLASISLFILAGLGIAMATTNPDSSTYEEYAAEQLTTYLKEDVCSQVPKAFEALVQDSCASLIDSNRPQIKQIIVRSTQRQNFIFFSIYRTNLSISSVVPLYRFQTVGVMQNFYTYSAKSQ
ncbi:DUF4359 domain-containing protein [Chlorogloea sp. CCALA 695]|uniref:DUF4359 domain-containing protein n=1 Tax=Chlorogloea sp. CCALA 695 TaxID=2107693 RepID=UPI000D04FB8A|nr:DUF4359 domain-containing protein [Chlorogloea sp. CCALA 695]PSB29683.1 hypothetical protein C7B70_17870 [Chlorogloea sp. CCALA 695]